MPGLFCLWQDTPQSCQGAVGEEAPGRRIFVASGEVSLKFWQRPNWQKPKVQATIGGVATLVLALGVIVALLATGGGSAVSDNAAVIGALIALGGVFTTQMVNAALENQRAHEAALQKYLEQVGKLLIEHPDAVNLNTVARAQTLAVLKGLRGDRDRKRVLMLFLSESKLLNEDNKPFLRLADLSDADLGNLDETLCGINLSDTHLQRANLSNTDLTGADLTGAYLTKANLKGATVTKEQLTSARSLEGATMPDGSKHG